MNLINLAKEIVEFAKTKEIEISNISQQIYPSDQNMVVLIVEHPYGKSLFNFQEEHLEGEEDPLLSPMIVGRVELDIEDLKEELNQ
jgi:hypothetical protein